MTKTNKVVSIMDRMERWSVVYASPDQELKISASNHGRVMIFIDNRSVTLPLVESISMLSRITDGISGAMDLIK